jgi:hypothetical protein
MNELEKQIHEKRFELSYDFNSFKKGAQFVQQLNIPILFWQFMQAHGKGMLNSGRKIETVYEYWINNVYGK